MTDLNTGIFIQKVDVLATSTLLRVGRKRDDICCIEDLSVGDEIYDPTEDRHVEITEMACVTLDGETVRDRGFSPKLLQGHSGAASLIYAVKVPVVLARGGYTPPIRGEFALTEGIVFYALGFERRAIVETPAALCEFVRPSLHAFESTSRRSPSVLPGESTLRAW